MIPDSILVKQTELIAPIINEPSWLDIATLILVFATTVFWGIYVYVTHNTFLELREQTQELKRQTILQTQGYLIMEPSIQKQTELSNMLGEELILHEKAEELHKKWELTLRDAIPKALQENEYAVLRLKNRGGSDILSVQISVQAKVQTGTYLKNSRAVADASESWKLDLEPNIVPEGEIDVVLAQINAFPQVTLTWTIEYQDIRENRLEGKVGKNEITHSNPLADPDPDSIDETE